MKDLAIIGAGPGGYVAAIAAAKKGLSVALIEKEHLGGVCLNWGCIPTKSLLKASEHVANLKHANNWGINIKSYDIDIKAMVEQSRKTVLKLTKGVEGLLKKAGVEIIKAKGKIEEYKNGEISVSCDGKQLKCKNLIIATGARQRSLPNIAFSSRIWSAKEAMTPSFLPKKICIVGAGAIGMEFASFYSALGSEVIVVEMGPEILPFVDPEIGQLLRKNFSKKGVTFLNNTKLESICEKKDGVELNLQGETAKFDAVIVAIGVIPNVDDFKDNLNLENGYIKTTEVHETNLKGIFAIGDCASGPWLAHKAMAEGVRVVKHICGEKNAKLPLIPSCVYTNPQIATIGLKEEECEGKDIKIGRFNLAGNGKALAMQENEGLIKVIFCNQTGKMLGLHMIGPEVTELIHSASLGITLEAVEEDWFNAIFPHPTISEGLQEAILGAFGKAIH